MFRSTPWAAKLPGCLVNYITTISEVQIKGRNFNLKIWNVLYFWVSLSDIGEAPGKAAYALEYGNVTIVIPAGVDYAAIREAHPGLLEKAYLLVLSPLDTSYIPPRLWSQLEPGMLLWNSLALSPFNVSFSTSESEAFSLISDGLSLWLEYP